MQTFLPHPDLGASAAALDDRRLGKQRVEALQILRALHLEDYGWATHPAVTMWRGHPTALIAYGLAIVDEWVARGHADTVAPQVAEFALPGPPVDWQQLDRAALPPWWGREDVHRSHRAALVRKDPQAYAELDVDDPLEPYVWPDPPVDPAPPLPFSAWVVRAAGPDDADTQAEEGLVTVRAPSADGSATRKQQRQRDRFAHEVAPGDRVVLSDGATLRVGTVVGPATADAAGHLIRPVRYRGRLPRGDLLRPWQLQDPSPIARLRGEPSLS